MLTINYSQCRHTKTWKATPTSAGNLRFRCAFCGKSWTTGSRLDRDSIFARKIEAGKLILNGLSDLRIAKNLGMCEKTVASVRELIYPHSKHKISSLILRIELLEDRLNKVENGKNSNNS